MVFADTLRQILQEQDFVGGQILVGHLDRRSSWGRNCGAIGYGFENAEYDGDYDKEK